MVKKCVVASGVLIRDDRVLMVKHRRLGVYLYPGGHVEEGETPIETLVREFEEETGLVVEPIGYVHGIKDDNVVERPLPFVILEEVVQYPEEVHIHFDLIYLVREVGGVLRSGMWIDISDIDSIETYPNVRNVIKLATRAINTLYRGKNV
ncbi:NUDIX hydrolase [Pyrobaculum islandicum DSM 4184]|uniref:NUDIX hydrolase n=1 Tax=Pyrobaculum islandicum (strain DSM 4184 / JCM 9189 / GEO3) TaxID=384616 RepID=A1RS01_PYRIL|nr:NUDIX domain-containing protein [Pyrobaculum islandicum]ABL87733.1 NUDIX hydrolase [Pyrobaculum islandicum DSM 4184]